MKLTEYPDSDLMMMDIASQLAGDLKNVLLTNDRASLVVPGGTTPGPIFDSLCAADIDWSRVDVILSDERWVPETSDRSNTRLVRERLMTGRAAAANMIPLYVEGARPEAALADLCMQIRPRLPISVMLLGMGADMHTASLFPGADRLASALNADAPELVALHQPGTGELRMTLTVPVLDGAMSKHIVITGADKKAAVEKARHLSKAEAPVTAVWSGATVHWAE